MLAPVVALCLLCGLSSGCASSLRLTLLAAAADPRSDVAIYMDVAGPQGQPVLDLRASDFRIYEDGQLVSAADSQLTLANQELAAQHFTVLLIEISSGVVMSDQLGAIRAAALAWLAQVQTHQRVAVYAFDGGKALHEIVAFQADRVDASRVIEALRRLEMRDPSTNLNGAVLQGLSELGRAVHAASVPLRYGTLVVLTDGVDRANRISQRQMLDAVEAAPYRVFTLGIGRELDDSLLSRLGKSGYIRVEDSSGARSAFRELAGLITRASRRQYLLRYCSSARSGRHSVRVEANTKAGRGSLLYAFSASETHAPCDLTRAPMLVRATR